jgi:hypothetical protein
MINGILATPEMLTSDVDRRAWSTVRVLNTSYAAAGCGARFWSTGSGVLLENRVVLTAAHAVAVPNGCDPSPGPYTAAQTSRIFVYSADTPSTTDPLDACASGACAQPAASGILINPNGSDTALLFLSTPHWRAYILALRAAFSVRRRALPGSGHLVHRLRYQ